MKTGAVLIADIDRCRPAEGQCAFWWLGQQGFVVKLGGTVCYLDAFLTPMESRQVPPMVSPQEVTHADVVLGSHDHADHIDRGSWPALARASTKARFVVPSLLLPGLARDLAIPLDRFVGLDDGCSADVAGLRITGIASAHEFLDRDPVTGRYPYLGFVIEGHGLTIYHAGDTCPYEGLQGRLRRWRFDVVFLPINGRDARRLSRNCIGNMVYQEAADLAGALEPRLTVPAHYDMFAMNGTDPAPFVEYMRVKYPALAVRTCEHGERVLLPAAGS